MENEEDRKSALGSWKSVMEVRAPHSAQVRRFRLKLTTGRKGNRDHSENCAAMVTFKLGF
uniref:Uncharacterized protein n=1 Tax=Anopheles minimus TaxID=112268 RepID=A0A182WQ57_9DIPT